MTAYVHTSVYITVDGLASDRAPVAVEAARHAHSPARVSLHLTVRRYPHEAEVTLAGSRADLLEVADRIRQAVTAAASGAPAPAQRSHQGGEVA